MLLVAFNLGRTSLVALHHQAVGAGAERHGRGVVQRNAGDDVFRSAHIRNDRLDRATAGGETCETERGTHQGQHLAAIHTVGGPFSGKIIIRFAYLAGDSPYKALLNPSLSPAGAKGNPVAFRLVVKPYQIQQDKTINNALRWYKDWCKYTFDTAVERDLDPEVVLPPPPLPQVV